MHVTIKKPQTQQSALKVRDHRATLIFLLVAFGFSWMVFFVPRLLSLHPGSWTETAILIVGMWGPGLAGMVATRFLGADSMLPALGIRAFQWRTRLTVLALLGPCILALATTMMALGLGTGRWIWPVATTPPLQAPAVFLLSATAGVLFNIPGALGEEIGWRGFLFPSLSRSGMKYPLVVGGLLWALWHIPLLVVRRTFPDHPVLGLMLLPVATTLLNVSLVRFRELTGAIWLSVLAHASINSWSGLPKTMLGDADSVIASLTGVAGWLPLAVFALFLTLGRKFPSFVVPRAATRRS